MVYRPKNNYPVLGFPPRTSNSEASVDARKDSSPNPTPIIYNRWIDSWHYRDATPGVKVNDGKTSTFTTIGASKVKTFSNNKDWKVLVAKGGNATYSYQRTGAKFRPVTWMLTSQYRDNFNDTYHGWGSGARMGSLLINTRETSALVEAASAQVKRKLNGNIGNAQLMAPLAESREIFRLVRQINGLSLEAIKALLAIRKTRGKSAFKFAADVWLMLGFGVNPLLKDIESAANAILDYTTRSDRHVRLTGTANRDWHSQGASTTGLVVYMCDMDIMSTAHHNQGVRIVAGIDLKIGTGSSYSVTDHLGLELSALPSTLWELTVYSWVVDYFITVGPWLDDMFFTLPGTTKYISQSTKYEVSTELIPKLVYTRTNTSVSGTATPGWLEYFSFARTSLSALPYRSIRIRSADEVAKHGLTKVLNLASVLIGRKARW